MQNSRLAPAVRAFRAFSWRANQLGSLRERFPLPKKPLRQSSVESLELVIHTEHVAGSKSPSQCGLRIRVDDSPYRPRIVAAHPIDFCGGSSNSGSGFE